MTIMKRRERKGIKTVLIPWDYQETAYTAIPSSSTQSYTQIPKSKIEFLLAPNVLAILAPALPTPESPTAAEANNMYERAAILGTFSSNNCNAGQSDVMIRDWACFRLPGQGVNVW